MSIPAKTILLTGFTAFGANAYNSSEAVAMALDGSIIGEARVQSAVLPVEFDREMALVRTQIEQLQPALVLLLGLHAGATAVEVERFAVNFQQEYDEEGNRSEPSIIDPAGPAAYNSTIPVPEVVKAIREVGVPAAGHFFAGAYLCNHVLYATLRELAAQESTTPCGFLHLPVATEHLLLGTQAMDGWSNDSRLLLPSLPLELLVRAVEAAIRVCVSE